MAIRETRVNNKIALLAENLSFLIQSLAYADYLNISYSLLNF